MKCLTGTVTHHDGRRYLIVSPDAAPHLRHLHLARWQMLDAQVGDRVELEYQVTSHSGLWNVVTVLNRFSKEQQS